MKLKDVAREMLHGKPVYPGFSEEDDPHWGLDGADFTGLEFYEAWEEGDLRDRLADIFRPLGLTIPSDIGFAEPLLEGEHVRTGTHYFAVSRKRETVWLLATTEGDGPDVLVATGEWNGVYP